MLATPTERRFSDPGWLFEPKLDGVRVLAERANGRTRLWSRNGNHVSASYPEVVTALDATLAVDDAVLDGEVVTYDDTGRSSFPRLQRRIHLDNPRRIAATGVEVCYEVFDLVRWDGHDTRRVPLRARKELLADVLSWRPPLRLVAYVEGAGERLYAEACAAGWEGVIAKRADSRYTPGRSRDWLKLKCVREQEVVVGGWTEPTGARLGLGALLVGYYDEGPLLRYAGKVGTGYTDPTLRDLLSRLAPLERSTAPFVDPPRERAVHWAEPRLVAQVRFAEWTSAGRLRHPAYRGLRTDKDPAKVVRET